LDKLTSAEVMILCVLVVVAGAAVLISFAEAYGKRGGKRGGSDG
jgi:hypothetical protein